ncbi:phosphoenolpyruvate phosphomutase [Candidatus Methanophagaceae archaeon]|nr:phosphoenolpyruvate phosphomutase [Methanophagales archaeon]
MKALILASGIGKRLNPITKEIPKPLVEIGNRAILGSQIDNLIGCGIKDVIITTGSFEGKIKEYIKERYPNLNVSYVNNPRYNSTNYIYSMWLTKEFIDDDIILLHGDLVFDRKLLERLIAENGNRVLVNKKIRVPDKDFKAVIVNDRVNKIGVEFSGKNAFACLPLYKFSKEDFLFWLNESEQYIERGEVNIYAENVFNDISDDLLLYPMYFDDELCMEIDTKEELEMAERIIKNI